MARSEKSLSPLNGYRLTNKPYRARPVNAESPMDGTDRHSMPIKLSNPEVMAPLPSIGALVRIRQGVATRNGGSY